MFQFAMSIISFIFILARMIIHLLENIFLMMFVINSSYFLPSLTHPSGGGDADADIDIYITYIHTNTE